MPISLFNLADSEATVGWRRGAPVSRHEFLARVASWHAALKPLPGQQFALYLEDSIEFAAALFGAWYAGKTIWLNADTLAGSIDALKHQVDGFIGAFPAGCNPITNPAPATLTEHVVLPGADFIAVVVHTSGSTGVAQAIPKKLSQLQAEVATLEQLFGARPGQDQTKVQIISTVSHQHIYGLLFVILWPFSTGRAVHAQTLIYPEQLAQQLASGPCVVVSSPAHLKRLPAHLDWSPHHVRAVFCSGGVLPAEVALSCSALLGTVPIEVYGSSETGGIAWRQRNDKSDDAWQAMPGVAWRCAPDSELIEVRSPHLFDAAWMTLSDRVQAVADGRFILKGRMDRIVKLEEKRISLDAVEQNLANSTLVAEVKIIVASTDQTQRKKETQRQHLDAIVVLSKQGEQCLQEQGKLAVSRLLKAHLNNMVEPVAVPRRWRYVDNIPVNAQGKATEALLHALFAGEDHQAANAPHYVLQHRDQQHAEFDVCWGRQLPYFAGHFPNAPVLPGVAQVHWAIKIGREFFDIPDSFHAMHGVKFQHVVLPDDVTQLKLQYDMHKHCLSFTYTSATKQHSSGKILFNA